MGSLFACLGQSGPLNRGAIGAGVLDKLLFLWTGAYSGENLLSDLDESVIIVNGKDFNTSYIPANSAATLKILFNGYWDIADTDNLFHSGIERSQTKVSDLIRCDYNRTLIKYSNTEPHNIQAIAILKPETILTNSEKLSLSRYLNLHKYFWGTLDVGGAVKSNRSAAHKETVLLSAILHVTGKKISLNFNKTVSGVLDNITDITLKVNGEAVEIYVDADWEPFDIFNVGLPTIAGKGDIITISITSNHIKGADNVPITAVNELAVINTIPLENFRIYQQSDPVQQFPHGCTIAGEKIFLGGRTDPATITRFNDIDNLTDCDTITVPGNYVIDTMVYDSIHDKIYFVTIDSEDIDRGYLKIYSLNINTLVYELKFSSGTLIAGASPAIVTDGVYIYGITYNEPTQAFKIRISDWQLVALETYAGLYAGHNLSIHKYNDGRVELYTAVRRTDPTALETRSEAVKFLKIDGGDLSFQGVDLMMGVITDDIDFLYVNEQGGKAFITGEFTDNILAVIDTASMGVQWVPACLSYGAFVSGSDLIITGADGEMLCYENMDFEKSPVHRIGKTPQWQMNELFTIQGRRFVTIWNGGGVASRLLEIGVSQTDNAIMNNNKTKYLTTEDEQFYLKMEV